MNEMRKLMEAVEDLSENPKEVYAPTIVDPKQVYEWVKIGHWSRGRFEAWVAAVLDKAHSDGFKIGYEDARDEAAAENYYKE